mmetsp:Transcript_33628/g.88346  ORF Transcript_33628/g.88346 Transcript_33628/m.88346 type:complete len:140 (-) Transcript_33628:156-575(-)
MAYDNKRLKEAFRLYSEDTEEVRAEHLGNVMRVAGANPTTEEVAAGRGGATKLSFAQVEAALKKQAPGGDPIATMQECLAMFDSAGTGTVEVGEFRAVLANLGDSFNHEEIGQLMLLLEINADGKFSIDGLVKSLSKYV